MKRFYRTLLLFSFILITPTWAWWGGGHDILTQAAIQTLPEEMPEFFRTATAQKMIAHCTYDPDISKERHTPHARAAEYGEHYFDLELIKDNPIPANRNDFIKLCAALELEPSKVGFLPYALAEWTERLAVAFAEHRKWPDNQIIRYKCFVYAGFLAHYAQDMCQPLHLTVNFDGIVQKDGTRLHRGIHEKVDSAVETLKLNPTDLAKAQEVKHVGDLMPAIAEQIKAGYGLVDNVYNLVEDFQNLKQPSPALVDFTTERSREAVRWTASLYLTAWKLSENLQLPGWLER